MAAVARYQPDVISLSGHGVPQHSRKSWFVTLSNTPTFGGGLQIAPAASLTDGLLNVTVVHGMGRGALLLHYPNILQGTHISLSGVMSFKVPGIEIATPRPQPAFGDGEWLGETPVRTTIQPVALQFLTEKLLKIS